MNTQQKVRIKRDGLPPISFTGELIAQADNRIRGGNSSTRWEVVEIYRTNGGKYVAQVKHLTAWQGESDRLEAASKATAAEVIQWLASESNVLDAVGQEAVEKAAVVDPSFAEAWVEEVE